MVTQRAHETTSAGEFKKTKCHYIAMELLATKPVAFWLMAVTLHRGRLIHEIKLF